MTHLAAAAALALAVQSSAGIAASPDLAWQPWVTVAQGEAFRGPWMMNDSEFRYVDDPTVVLFPDGDAGVAWVEQARKDIRFQRYGPGGTTRLDTPVNVSATPEVFSWLPRMAVAPGEPNTLYVLWQEIVFSGGSHGGEIYFARSEDGGRSFSDALNLSQTQAGAGKGRLSREYWHNGSLDLAVAPDGTVYAAWTEYQGRLRLARSTDGGRSFSEPRRIAGGGDRPPTRGPTLAAGANGELHLAWTVGGDPQADIHYAHSSDGGMSFSAPERVAAGEAHADAPKLALDDAGMVHLAFARSPGGPLGHYRIRYARRGAGASGFSEPRGVSADLPAGFRSAGFPYLATGGGQVFLAFELFRDDARERPRALALVWSDDGGERFTQPTIVPGTAEQAAGVNGSQQGLLMRKLAADTDNGIALVNSKFNAGDASRIRLYRATPRSGD